MTNEASVLALAKEATGYLRKAGYTEETIERHRSRWQALIVYARKQKKRQSFSALAKQFLASLPVAQGPYWHRSRTVPHSMRILMEFAATGRHRACVTPVQPSLPAVFENGIERALLFAAGECGWVNGTIISRRAWMKRFIRHLIAERGIRRWKDVVATDVPAYLSSLQVSHTSKAVACYSIRAMFRILFVQGILFTPLHELIPPFWRPGEAKLSTIWRPTECASVLASVDRSTAIGKRDYAVLLLAMRLGLRACDIRHLCLDNIHWERSCLEIVQQKTHEPLTLPLLPEVGDALIDYLRHGRPSGQFREVFLRHLAPHGPYRKYCFHYMLRAYRKKAGLPARQYRMGLSSLRHTLATQMLEDGVGVETIAGVLGHTNVETTRRYIRVDLPMLRQAALDPEKEVAHA